MTPDARPTTPTVEEIVFARDFTCSCEFDNEYARCPLHSLLERFRDAIQSGDYAILSRADRDTAIARAMKAMHLKDVGLTADAEQARSEAYQLLQLQEPK